MPARLVIKSGVVAGKEYPIQDEVLRIGSDSICELSLPDPGLAGHAVTLEFRDGSYFVHNRSDKLIRLNGQPLAVRAFRSWGVGQDLQLTEQLVLRLTIDGNAAPMKAQAPAPVRDARTPIQADTLQSPSPQSATGGSKNTGSYAIIIVSCLLLAGYFMYYDSGDGPVDKAPQGKSPQQEFQELDEELSQDKRDSKAGPDSIRFLLKEARIAQLRGQRSRARDKYGQIQQALLTRRNSDGSFARDLDERTWNFVLRQIRSLRDDETS